MSASLFQPQYGGGQGREGLSYDAGKVSATPVPIPFPLPLKPYEMTTLSNSRGCVGVKWGYLLVCEILAPAPGVLSHSPPISFPWSPAWTK